MAEKIAKKVTDLVGHTPLLELSNIEKKYNLKARVLAKLEYLNPAGSVKDRIAKAMIDEGIKAGKIHSDSVIIEPTSGNTGIGLASVAASYGLKIILTMPETMSIERRKLLKAYGAEIVLTDGATGMQGAVDKANELAKKTPHSFIPGQFDNPVNPETHYKTTGPEIWEDTCLAKLISWVTNSMVRPSSAKARITPSTSCTISGSSAEVGSSNKITFGCIAKVRAIAARCCWPPDN